MITYILELMKPTGLHVKIWFIHSLQLFAVVHTL